MKKEIAVVIFFLKAYLKKSSHDSEKIDLFVERLAVALHDKFKGHWYPDNPSKGQAYRCIRLNKFYTQDPEILRACQESGIEYKDLKLPDELTLWVDPGEVCCRYEEYRHFFPLATLSKDEDEKELAKKVTKALERVTSDYHSGSSSDEETSRKSTFTIPNRYFNPKANNSAHYHSQRMERGSGNMFPKPPHMSRPRHRPAPSHWMRQYMWANAAQSQHHHGNWRAPPIFHQYY
ncbi:hypothetical protein NL108_014916 [Boleophthalmus pectinirostris]|uniref:protein BTG3 n=1 Tax=Boleophthalmus pectinirostris TaxID=150288 RepID=UPI000A1C4536|nr:protein BTG3 [Boleophthalmus pectinirostris]KAJ0062007.1 hypothetical protein NL108_014916 [Boleophthalmus pectinirostris]